MMLKFVALYELMNSNIHILSLFYTCLWTYQDSRIALCWFNDQCFWIQQYPLTMSQYYLEQIIDRNLSLDGNSRVDDLLLKNQLIYTNLRSKLQQINQAEHNINLNIGRLKPLDVGTSPKESQSAQDNRLKISQQSYMPSFSKHPQQSKNFNSSPIATERQINDSLRKRLEGIHPNKTPATKPQQITLLQSRRHCQQLKANNSAAELREINQIRWPLGLGILNATTTTAMLKSQDLVEKPFFQQSGRSSQGTAVKNSHYQNLFSSVRRNQLPVNFEQANQRKQEIQRLYEILRAEEELINQQYQIYKENLIKSRRSSRNNSDRKKQPQQEDSGDCSASKIRQQRQSMGSSSRQKQSSKHKQSPPSPSSSTILKRPGHKYQMSSQLEGLNLTYHEFTCSHLFVPFNKLYKSPIMQMKNQHQIILANHCKTIFKNSDNRMFDGKKYKTNEAIETCQDQLISRVLSTNSNHHAVAIVGGRDTLKKKIHIGLLEQFLDHILRFIYQTGIQFNFLTFTLEHNEEILTKNKQDQVNDIPRPDKIQLNIDIQPNNIKLCVLQIQKTLEQVSLSMRRDLQMGKPRQASLSAAYKNAKKVQKLTRFTSMSLCSHKQCLWSGHLVSTNDFSADFVRQLNVKNVIWSVNPLVKNYDDVSKTLVEMERYGQNEKFSKTKKSLFN